MRVPTNDWVGAQRRVTISTEKLKDGRFVARAKEVKEVAGFANDPKQAVNQLKKALADKEARGAQNWAGQRGR